MESGGAFAGLRLKTSYHHRFSPPPTAAISSFNDKPHFSPLPLKFQKQSHFASYSCNCCKNDWSAFQVASPARLSKSERRKLSGYHIMKVLTYQTTIPSGIPQVGSGEGKIATPELPNIDWDNLGFGVIPTDYMYHMKCSRDGNFSKGELQRFGNIELSPASGILNYGQGLFEGLKAYKRHDGNILLFRPEENALRMKMGAERICMPSPSVEQFVQAVKATVLANERWIPPPGKGSLYIRPLLMGTGAILGVAPAPEYTFLIYVSPVGNYFKEGMAPINLVVETEIHRATPGGTGGVKTIGNYAAVLKAQSAAKAKGYSDVLYLDSVNKRYLEEVSSCNVFIVKGNLIATPAIRGTILPGITRKSIIDVALSQGLKVEERQVSVDELLDADEVFCTGTAVVVSPVGSITHLGKRVTYGSDGVGRVSKQLYSALTSLQMGLAKDNMNWIVELK